MKKTWKIGEYCKGGIISVEVNKSEVVLYLKEWDYSKGSNAKSNQSNAKILETVPFSRSWIKAQNVSFQESILYNKISATLNDWTTFYYSDKIMEWIKEAVK
jgi:hypothetical protein